MIHSGQTKWASYRFSDKIQALESAPAALPRPDGCKRNISRIFCGCFPRDFHPLSHAMRGVAPDETAAENVRRHLTTLAALPFRDMPPLKQSMAKLGHSYYHLERLFKAQYGLSPTDYVTLLRVEQIKQYLLHSDRGIAEIAYETGFDDLGYFSRYFRKHTGASPRLFRKRS